MGGEGGGVRVLSGLLTPRSPSNCLQETCPLRNDSKPLSTSFFARNKRQRRLGED